MTFLARVCARASTLQAREGAEMYRIARIESSDRTLANVIMGTPGYIAPEHYLGQPTDHRIDKARQFFGRLALDAHRDQDRPAFQIGDGAVQQLREQVARLLDIGTAFSQATQATVLALKSREQVGLPEPGTLKG